MRSNTQMKRFLIILASFFMSISGCSSFLYYPTTYKHINEEILQYKPQEIAFDINGKGITLNKERSGDFKSPRLGAWYFSKGRKNQKSPKAILIFFHGNAQNISTHFVSLFWILEYDYDYFIFDYPGYGVSEGDPSPKNTLESGLAAIHLVREKWPKVPIIIFGQSLGGAISLRALADLKDRSGICGIATESTFDSYKSVGRSALSSSFLTWAFQPLAYLLLSDEYAPKGHISKISPIPLLVMHRKADSIVPSYLGKRVFNEAIEPKKLWLLEGRGHGDIFLNQDHVNNRKKFLEVLDHWLESCPHN